MKQASMFQSEDLPLFSGTAPRAEVEEFEPQLATRQTEFNDRFESVACPVCRDYGMVLVGKEPRYCFCEAGQRVKREHQSRHPSEFHYWPEHGGKEAER